MATRGKKTNRERIHPKLKMISDGDTYVNTLRAEHAAAIGISNSQVLKSVPLLRGDSAAPSDKVTAHRPPKKLRMVSPDTVVNVFVELQESSDPNEPVHGETDRVGTIATAQLSLNDLGNLLADERVTYVSLGEPLTPPRPSVATDDISAPTAATRGVPRANVHHQGANVLIGIIDVEGFDFAHPDFLDAGGNTRFERIWDQGGDARPSPHGNHNAGFDYGAEFTREVLDAALEAAPTIGVPATEIERQSQMAAGSHGTHVASIAAGNLGVCSRAVIAAVLLDLAEGDLDRRRSFYDSTRLAHAVAYLFALGEELGLPVSVNVSLGTNGHAHDASSPSSRWLDAALSVPSRAICVAAGNAGQEGPSGPGDFGFIMGRIHTNGRIAAAGLDVDLEWQVIGNTIADLSENELEIWYSAQDRFSVSVRTPAGQWIGPVSPGEFIENQQLPDATFISIYSELYHPANGNNYMAIYLSPLFDQSGIVGVSAGQWIVRLTGIDVRDGRFDGWIERDDPRRLGDLGPQEAWRFPSFFSTTTNVDDSSISSLACGQRVVAVANLDAEANQINISSSQGPTRDEREKPEVAAPGTNIAAANGFGLESEPWIAHSGTSMASPYVAGVAGLMLGVEPRLTAAQILGIIKRTAQPLPGDDFQWKTDAGFGGINAEACVSEAASAFEREDLSA